MIRIVILLARTGIRWSLPPGWRRRRRRARGQGCWEVREAPSQEVLVAASVQARCGDRRESPLAGSRGRAKSLLSSIAAAPARTRRQR